MPVEERGNMLILAATIAQAEGNAAYVEKHWEVLTVWADYLSKQNIYGLPLDNRRTYTKSDWITWTATLANDQETFRKFIDPLHKTFNETTSRVPMTDWYETPDAKQVGFQARSVVAGYFMKMLEQKSVKK